MVYVNYGCGFEAGEGWLNFDASPTLRFERIPVLGRLYTKNEKRFPKAARYGDIVKEPLCVPGTAEGVYACHILEHLSRAECRMALHNTYTMMKPGGLFRLVVPDLEVRMGAYLERLERGETDAASHFMEETMLGRVSPRIGIFNLFVELLVPHTHSWMWDEASLTAELATSGFREIQRCAFGDADDPMFSKVETASRFESELGPELALECRK